MVFRLFSVALSTVEVGNLFGLFSVDGSGRWIPSDGRRRKKKTREREREREREGFFCQKSKSRVEMVGTQDPVGIIRVRFSRKAFNVKKICPSDCLVLKLDIVKIRTCSRASVERENRLDN